MPGENRYSSGRRRPPRASTMNPVPPPDPEVVKHCRFDTGDTLYFVFENMPTGEPPRPMTADEILQLSPYTRDLIDPDVLRQRLTPEQLRQVRPDLLPPESNGAPPAQS